MQKSLTTISTPEERHICLLLVNNAKQKPMTNEYYAQLAIIMRTADRHGFLENLPGMLNITSPKGSYSQDTLRYYMAQIREFYAYCVTQQLDPLTDVTANEILLYRGYLQEVAKTSANKPLNVRSIAIKLAAIRRFYFSAVICKLITHNPAEGISIKNKHEDEFGTSFFTAETLSKLFQMIKTDDPTDAKYEENLRAKVIIALMAIEGLRRVEVHRMSTQDIDWQQGIIRIHGKGKQALIYPRSDTLEILSEYIRMRRLQPGLSPTPVFTSVSNRNAGTRISRTTLNNIVDYWFTKANIKESKKSCHVLRHSAGTLLYHATKDLRLVQDTLRHDDPKTTAKYAHVYDKMKNRSTSTIPVSIFTKVEE